jgi:PAS domain S-box-containing protein
LVALLCAEGKHEAAIRLEQLWNDLARTHAFSLHCAYPIGVFGRAEHAAAIGEICGAHSGVLPAEDYSALTDEAARRRTVALLQQKAQALEVEVEARRQAQRLLEQRETELADLLDHAVEGVQQVDGDQVIRWANRAQLELLGYPAAEYVGHSLAEFFLRRETCDELWETLRRREEIRDFPADLRCRDGTVRHVLVSADGRWEDGRFAGARCFVRDVTEQRQMERALRQRSRELSAAVAARDEFLSLAAHELKTPMTSLRAVAQLLLRDRPEGTRRRRAAPPERLEFAFDAIEQQTGKLSNLVSRLLEAAQLETGKFRIEPVATDLVALVRGTVAQQRPGAPGASGHSITVVGPERLEATVDPARFEQAIANLLDNAVKFSPDGAAVRVELERLGDGGVRLAVTDHGPGVPADQREQVFARFHQAHNGRHASGLGLGLYLTREIVERHGGSVRLEQPAHPGSRFVVTLPSAAGARDQPAA